MADFLVGCAGVANKFERLSHKPNRPCGWTGLAQVALATTPRGLKLAVRVDPAFVPELGEARATIA
jgi:hypothetical protein